MTTILQAVESALAQMNNAKRDFAEESSRVREGLQDISLEIKKLKEEIAAENDTETKSLLAIIQALRDELTQTRAALSQAIEQTRSETEAAHAKAQKGSDGATQAQKAANAANSAVNGLRSDIQTGKLIAQKAEMLRARDERHWMRWHEVDAANHDVFMLWRVDNTWHRTIRVVAADRLLARDDAHWMQHKGVDAENQDCYGLWRRDGAWFNLIQVAAVGLLP